MASKHRGLAIASCLKACLVAAINAVLDNFTKDLARQVAHTRVQMSKAMKDEIVTLEPAYQISLVW
jgi:hypothetical protein